MSTGMNTAADQPAVVAGSDGSQATNATSDSAIDNFPTWTPDGRLTFVSNRDGGFDIFVEAASEPVLK